MSQGQSKHAPIIFKELEFPSSPLDAPPDNSAASKLIEIGVLLAETTFVAPRAGLCFQCRSHRDARSSTAQYRNLFCSQHCEREFVGATLASVTLEECLRIQERLEALLATARQTCPTNHVAG